MKNAEEEFASKLDEHFGRAIPGLSLSAEVFYTAPIPANVMELFVGRDPQISELLEGLTACLKGIYKKIIIYGDAGVGKTLLLNVVVGAASKSIKAKYEPLVVFDSSDYVKSFKECYENLLSNECTYLGNLIEEMRDDSEEGLRLKAACAALSYDIIRGNFKELQHIMTRAKELKFLQNVVDAQFIEKALIKEISEKIFSYDDKARILVSFDDFHKILDDKLRHQLLEVVNNEKWFSILIMHTSELNKLKSSQDEIVKDAYIVEVPPLTLDNCKELLRLRILRSHHKYHEMGADPDYSKELMPFNESAVELLAKATGFNALNFVKILKKAYLEAEKLSSPVINQDIVLRMMNVNVNLKMSPRERDVLNFIKSTGEARIQDIADLRNTSRISAYFILKNLLDAGLLIKTRRKREMIYTIKPIES